MLLQGVHLSTSPITWFTTAEFSIWRCVMSASKIFLRSSVLLSLLLSVGSAIQAQDRQVQFSLVNLHNHTPVANQHLTVFTGATVREARKHSIQINIQTDSKGLTSLKLGPRMVWFQVWLDGPKSCPGSIPSRDVFHRGVLLDEGALVSNTCGIGLERLQPYFAMAAPIVSQ
jgi:hypothetical protein